MIVCAGKMVCKGMLVRISISAQFKKFTDYWELLQAEAEGPIPAKSQLNPGQIASLLPYVYLLEHKSDDEMIMRLVGTSLDEIASHAYTGSNFFDFCPPEDVFLYKEVNKYRSLVPCGTNVVRDLTFESGKNYTLSSIGYPMADNEGALTYSIGVMILSRHFEADEMDNGGVTRSVLRSLDYIDIGFGVPETSEISAPHASPGMHKTPRSQKISE